MPNTADTSDMDNTRRRLLAYLGVGGTVGLAGCAGIFDDEEDPETPDPDEIPMDGEFVASVGANPATPDPTVIGDAPSSAIYGSLIYETLVDLSFDLSEVVPSLATDWEQIDETTWQFDLREGVEFHNGDEFTADDVVFSVLRMQGTVNHASVAWYEDHEVVDDHTVQFETTGPYAPFLNDMAAVPIVPSNVDGISEDPEADDFPFDEESIGTGPFILDEYIPDDRVDLVRNDDYWWDGDGDIPEVSPWETVRFQVVPQQTSQQEAIQTGELHLIDNPGPFELDIFDDDPDIEVVTGIQVGFDFISFPTEISPYSNEKFRRGITRLIPRDEIIEAIFGGYATPLGGPISPGLGDFWDEEHEQELLDQYVGEDPEEADQLLEEAFEEEGIEPPFELDLITNVNRTRERWMEVIQARLDETEWFDAGLDIQDFDVLVPHLLGGEAAESENLVGIGWTGGSDPDGHVEQLIHSNAHVPDGFNWNLYSNQEADSLIEQGQQTIDIDERRDIYHQLQELLAEDVPDAYMWTSDQIDVVRTDEIENWRTYPNSSMRYAALYKPNLGHTSWPVE